MSIPQNIQISLMAVVLWTSTISCSETHSSKSNTDVNFSESRNMIEYPYYASPERQALLHNNYVSISISMTQDKVIALMGNPDEVNPTYSAKDGRPQVGSSYIYLIQRLVPLGSENERQERLIRVHFDTSQRVARVDVKGIHPDQKESLRSEPE